MVETTDAHDDGASVPDAADAAGPLSSEAGAPDAPNVDVGVVSSVGCADGEREGFLDQVDYPDIAACGGGFGLPGVVGLTGPACNREGGDDGPRPDGAACNALDLCAAGFHLCATAAEVGARSSTGCVGAAVGATPVFYVTAQSGGGQANCDATGTDDVFGCGTHGARPNAICAPLDAWGGNLCASLGAPWSCDTDQRNEALYQVKDGSSGGGVLCCRD
jgi:hypothetical protein